MIWTLSHDLDVVAVHLEDVAPVLDHPGAEARILEQLVDHLLVLGGLVVLRSVGEVVDLLQRREVTDQLEAGGAQCLAVVDDAFVELVGIVGGARALATGGVVGTLAARGVVASGDGRAVVVGGGVPSEFVGVVALAAVEDQQRQGGHTQEGIERSSRRACASMHVHPKVGGIEKEEPKPSDPLFRRQPSWGRAWPPGAWKIVGSAIGN
jgi:hypothetical protein